LLKIVRRVLKQADRGQQQVTDSADASVPRQKKWLSALAHYRDLASRVIEQTERRVIQGKRVPSSDKIVSLFEPHTVPISPQRRTEKRLKGRMGRPCNASLWPEFGRMDKVVAKRVAI